MTSPLARGRGQRPKLRDGRKVGRTSKVRPTWGTCVIMNRVKIGWKSGAIGGFIAGFTYPILMYLPDIKSGWIDFEYMLFPFLIQSVIVGFGGMILLAVAGAIKGKYSDNNLSLLKWMLTGFTATLIASIPLMPGVYITATFAIIYARDTAIDMESGQYMFRQALSIIPVMYMMGILGGFIAGKMAQWFERQYEFEG